MGLVNLSYARDRFLSVSQERRVVLEYFTKRHTAASIRSSWWLVILN